MQIYYAQISKIYHFINADFLGGAQDFRDMCHHFFLTVIKILLQMRQVGNIFHTTLTDNFRFLKTSLFQYQTDT